MVAAGSADDPDDLDDLDDLLWGPIPRRAWREVPCMRGALATREDVRAARAVFHVADPANTTARPAAMSLPALALWPDPDANNLPRPVVVIQVEHGGNRTVAGIRFLDGGNGVCLLEELEMIEETDYRWLTSA
jgi:hypothetical protein